MAAFLVALPGIEPIDPDFASFDVTFNVLNEIGNRPDFAVLEDFTPQDSKEQLKIATLDLTDFGSDSDAPARAARVWAARVQLQYSYPQPKKRYAPQE